MKTETKNTKGLKVTTSIKSGGFTINRNRAGMVIKTNIRAGEGIMLRNHSRRLA